MTSDRTSRFLVRFSAKSGFRGELIAGAAAATLGMSSIAAQAATYTTFDPGVGKGAWATSISNGDITGETICGQPESYYDCAFVRTADGTSTTLSESQNGTYSNSINKRGKVTGYYYDNQQVRHGFYWTQTGKIKVFDPKGSTATDPTGINDEGVIEGYYTDGNAVQHGFVRTANGQYTTFDPSGSVSTEAASINDSSVIVGSYKDTNGVLHGFERTADGTITTFDPPGSSVTTCTSINKKGLIVGFYFNNNMTHGFVRATDGTFATFDPKQSLGTSAESIDDAGRIAGYYTGPGEYVHGFVRDTNGKIKSFDVPGYTGGTLATGIYNGAIVGSAATQTEFYETAFLRAP